MGRSNRGVRSLAAGFVDGVGAVFTSCLPSSKRARKPGHRFYDPLHEDEEFFSSFKPTAQDHFLVVAPSAGDLVCRPAYKSKAVGVAGARSAAPPIIDAGGPPRARPPVRPAVLSAALRHSRKLRRARLPSSLAIIEEDGAGRGSSSSSSRRGERDAPLAAPVTAATSATSPDPAIGRSTPAKRLPARRSAARGVVNDLLQCLAFPRLSKAPPAPAPPMPPAASMSPSPARTSLLPAAVPVQPEMVPQPGTPPPQPSAPPRPAALVRPPMVSEAVWAAALQVRAAVLHNSPRSSGAAGGAGAGADRGGAGDSGGVGFVVGGGFGGSSGGGSSMGQDVPQPFCHPSHHPSLLQRLQEAHAATRVPLDKEAASRPLLTSVC